VLLLLAASLIAGAGFLILPYPVNVRIEPEPTQLRRYDDGAGNSPLLAVMRVTNASSRTVWFVGPIEMPSFSYQQMVDGKWDHRMSGDLPGSSSNVWTA
jgi:hypothetical protein